MWNYEIAETDLGWLIRKNKEIDGVKVVLYWNGKRWDNRRACAKVYWFKDEALSSFIIAKKI